MQREKSFSYPACKSLATLGAHKGSGHKVGVMVATKMHVQELFLSESFLTVAAGVWLFPSVGALVHYHVALLAEQEDIFSFY